MVKSDEETEFKLDLKSREWCITDEFCSSETNPSIHTVFRLEKINIYKFRLITIALFLIYSYCVYNIFAAMKGDFEWVGFYCLLSIILGLFFVYIDDEIRKYYAITGKFYNLYYLPAIYYDFFTDTIFEKGFVFADKKDQYEYIRLLSEHYFTNNSTYALGESLFMARENKDLLKYYFKYYNKDLSSQELKEIQNKIDKIVFEKQNKREEFANEIFTYGGKAWEDYVTKKIYKIMRSLLWRIKLSYMLRPLGIVYECKLF